MIVLSLFDGMACGYEALKRAGIKVTKYYASEIDKHAIKIAMKNHPDIIQLGDVKNWHDWDIEKPDLIMGGSPCQGFSFAGNQLAFDDPRSRLFFDMMNIINYHDPKYRLLENTPMKQQFIDVITKCMGVEPVKINSALVSAQNRVRLYWCNWEVNQPEDRKIFLEDVLKDCPIPSIGKPQLIHSKKAIDYMNRKVKGGRNHWDFKHHSNIRNEKSSAVVANFLKGVPYNVLKDWSVIRKFHPIECERLQTLPDNYTEGVSNTQRYKMIGNGWNVETIAHIFEQSPFSKGEMK